MQLTEFLNSVKSRVRGWVNVALHPQAILLQEGERRGREQLERVEFPLGKKGSTAAQSLDYSTRPAVADRSTDANQNGQLPQRRSIASETLTSEQRICREQFKYKSADLKQQVSLDADPMQGWVRWYRGSQMIDNKSVLIREYKLPTRLDEAEVEQRKARFDQINRISFSQAGRDFRLLLPLAWDVSVADRCYLVIDLIGERLRDYLAVVGRGIAPQQVRQILKQILQTLWFLHTQKVRLATGEVKQGLAHGSLSLDSLRCVQQTSLPESESPLLIYVSDLLGAGESLFVPSDVAIEPSMIQDLRALGYIAFSLLTGVAIDPQVGEAIDLRSLDFDLEQRWQEVRDRPLKQFVAQLLGQSRPALTTAFAAREALMNLAPPDLQAELAEEPEFEKETRGNASKLLALILIGCLTAAGFIAVSWLWKMVYPAVESVIPAPPRRMSEVGFSTDKTTYTVQNDSVWATILGKTGLIAPNQTLLKELQTRNPTLRLPLAIDSRGSFEQQQNRLKQKEIDFILAEMPVKGNESSLDDALEVTTVAYDGIVVFVAFNDALHQQNIPSQLKGSITFNQLKHYYSSNPPQWDLPDGLAGKTYLPFEQSAIDRFQQRVLGNARFHESPEKILLQQQQEFKKQKVRQPDETSSLFGQILKDSKDSKNDTTTVGIGFGFLSTLLGQCSVYPLAVAEASQPISPLIQNDTQKPIDPTTDLCSKGSYSPNIAAFKSGAYPLAYSLVVIHRKDENSSAGDNFAKMLKTDEGQCLLSKAGLVPLRPHPCDRP